MSYNHDIFYGLKEREIIDFTSYALYYVLLLFKVQCVNINVPELEVMTELSIEQQ